MADVVVVGSGPNGLAAAIAMARAGRSVLVLEAKESAGGGIRSEALTLPGFTHDLFSAIHPLGNGSPFFRTLPLAEHGLEWIHPPIALAHPLDDGTAPLLERSIPATARTLGPDAGAYRRLFEPLAAGWSQLAGDALGPLHLPDHPVLLARFGLRALQSARGLANRTFDGGPARALFAGVAAHAAVPLNRAATAAFGLVLMAAGHAVGWPIPRGGSGSIARALSSYLRSLGGTVETGAHVRTVADLPPARSVFFDVTPRQLLGILGERLPSRYRRQLQGFRYGPGVFKVDWALREPIPWKSPACTRAGTIHLGGTQEEIAHSELQSWRGQPPTNPYVLLAQPSLFDATRAPAGRHTAWAYCHVPNGCTVDMSARIEAQVNRFAPGFPELILARSTMGPAELERRNPNLVGGDINGGAAVLGQLFFRPVLRLSPYSLPIRGYYLCSASTPPGGGVHGLCGYHAAQAALRDGF